MVQEKVQRLNVSQEQSLFQNVGVQFQENNYQPEIKVSELCDETACLYKAPADQRTLCEKFGIGSKIDHAVKNLSGGERQRLFIVLALIPNPKLVFLNELTTGLDTKARRDVWKILSELKDNGLTIFLTSHFMDEVESLCDEICILKKGKAVFYGTVEFLGLPIENVLLPVGFMGAVIFICLGISVKCFKWE